MENNLNSEEATKVIFSLVVPKLSKDGKHQTGSITIETKEFKGSKFVQLTQEKFPFRGQIGKITCVTFDPSNQEIRDAILEAIDK